MSNTINTLSDYRKFIALVNAGVADGERESINIYTSNSDETSHFVSLEYNYRIPKGIINKIDFDSPANTSNLKQMFNGKNSGTQKVRETIKQQEEKVSDRVITEQIQKDIRDFFDKNTTTTWGKITTGTTTVIDPDKVTSTPGFGPIDLEGTYGDSCCDEKCEACAPEELEVDAEPILEVGSVVQLKSGEGPIMTVSMISDAVVSTIYFCTYTGKFVYERFSKAVLHVIK